MLTGLDFPDGKVRFVGNRSLIRFRRFSFECCAARPCVLKTHFADGPSAWWSSGNNDPYREIFLTWLRSRATLMYVHRPGRSVLASHYQQHIQREDSRHLKFSDWLRMKDEAGRSRPLAWAAHVGQWAHRSEVARTWRFDFRRHCASVRSLADAIGLEPDREPALPKAWQSLTARRCGPLLLVSPESTAQLGYHRRAGKARLVQSGFRG